MSRCAARASPLAGPAGLTAALYCAEKGHKVVVFEANEKVGGQMRYGIPAYRLPDATVDAEVATILEIAQGDDAEPRIELRCGERIADFLKDARMGSAPDLTGKRVVVLGGGNVAYDCARTAVRLGAASVDVACLEAQDAMTSTPEERAEAAEEGVVLHDAYAFTSINETEDGSGKVGSMTIHKIERFYFDENHRAVTELLDGGEKTIDADCVIFAVGQKPEGTAQMGLELTHGPYIVADTEGKTSVEGIWSAGDCVTGTKSVIAAIAAGRTCASAIDRALGGDGNIDEELTEHDAPEQWIGRVPEGFYDDAVQPEFVDAQTRKDNFDTFECPYTDHEATCEASRCLQCDLRLTISTPRLWNEY